MQFTVHGSLSTYEGNVPFAVFYPGETGSPTKMSNIDSFLSEVMGSQYANTNLLTTEIFGVVTNAVERANLILME